MIDHSTKINHIIVRRESINHEYSQQVFRLLKHIPPAFKVTVIYWTLAEEITEPRVLICEIIDSIDEAVRRGNPESSTKHRKLTAQSFRDLKSSSRPRLIDISLTDRLRQNINASSECYQNNFQIKLSTTYKSRYNEFKFDCYTKTLNNKFNYCTAATFTFVFIFSFFVE